MDVREGDDRPPRLPLWSAAYATFRFGDGASHALVPLAVVLHYDLPLWALALATAAMNLAGVPAAFLWGSAMEGGRRRRRIAVAGFAAAAVAMGVLALLPPFPVFVAAAILFTVFGVSTAPAASILVLEGVPRRSWGRATGALSRLTGFGFLAGMTSSILLGLTVGVRFPAVFGAVAAVTATASLVAWRTMPPYQPALPHDPGYDPLEVKAAQRRFDRPVFFPARLRHVPTLAGVRASLRGPPGAPGLWLWPLGITLTFAGSVMFFSSYPGVLSDHLGLSAGLVLLAQAPSHVMTPLTYAWAGRLGSRHGEGPGVLRGVALRVAALPLLCVAVVWGGVGALPALLLLHAAMGLSFAFIQVNGPCILAELHPRGRGQGVGTYHAAVGTGTVCGSLGAFLILRVAPFWASYLASLALAGAGALSLYLAVWRTARPRPAPGSASGPAGTPAAALSGAAPTFPESAAPPQAPNAAPVVEKA